MLIFNLTELFSFLSIIIYLFNLKLVKFELNKVELTFNVAGDDESDGGNGSTIRSKTIESNEKGNASETVQKVVR